MKLQVLSAMTIAMLAIPSWAATYRCLGTEPFFNVDINTTTDRLRYRTPTNQTGTLYRITNPLQAAGIQTGNVFMFKGTRSDISATLMHRNIAGRSCSDGASDTVYTYHLVFNRGTAVRYGCCNRIN